MMPSPNNLAQGATEGKRSPNSKRIAVLNKLFMRYITDLMATGTSSAEFLGKGIEINRVNNLLMYSLRTDFVKILFCRLM